MSDAQQWSHPWEDYTNEQTELVLTILEIKIELNFFLLEDQFGRPKVLKVEWSSIGDGYDWNHSVNEN